MALATLAFALKNKLENIRKLYAGRSGVEAGIRANHALDERAVNDVSISQDSDDEDFSGKKMTLRRQSMNLYPQK